MNHDTEVCTICLASAEDWSLHGEESFRAIFESAPDPVFVHDIETGAILEANRAACDLHGAGIDELRRLGLRVLGTGEPPYSSADALAWMEEAKTGQPQLFEWQIRDSTGCLRHSEVSMRRAIIGGHARVIVIVRDITDRKRAEEARLDAERRLRTSEARLQAILNTSGAGIAYTNPEGLILYSNGAFQRLVGYEEGDLLGADITSFAHPSYVDTGRALLEEGTTSAQRQYRAEMPLVSRYGPEIWADVTVSAVLDEQDRILHLMLVAVDITERKRIEDALRDSERMQRRMIEELRIAKETADAQARTDPLTGALNRRAILEILNQELERARREGTPLSVAMLDLDRFKDINDTFGHDAGDRLLCELVRQIPRGARPYDRLGRLGGDEFLLIMPGTGESAACSAIERIRNEISQLTLQDEHQSLAVTVSVGGATSRGEPAAELLHRADTAMYQAKEAGRNRLIMAGPQSAS